MLCRNWLSLLTFVLGTAVASADVKPHPLFSDNMVLQRDTNCLIWGTADPGENVNAFITVKNAIKPLPTVVDEKGNWKVTVSTQGMKGFGYNITVSGKNSIELKNVAIGDVWLCSGQSNMEWKLSQLNKEDKAKGTTAEQGKEVAAKADNKMIRLFTVPNKAVLEPQSSFAVTDTEGKWLTCNEQNVFNFSAVGYFFGRDIAETQNVPVGLIAADWGGTPAEAWTSQEALNAVQELKYYHEKLAEKVKAFDKAKAEEKHKADLEKWKTATEKWKEDAAKAKEDGKVAPQQPRRPQAPTAFDQNSPSSLFNGMIAPITQLKIKGAIWYQGESNNGRAAEYYTLLPTMIQDWRKRWDIEFPFFVVQLAPYWNSNAEQAQYAELRDAQFQASKKLKNVGYATLSDVGNEKDIHPQKKEPVGQRLALAARAIAYGEEIEWSGPVYNGMKLDGNKIVVSFEHIGKGLACTGDKLTGFQICGEDKKFVAASAEIQGSTVVVSASNVEKPVAVRFGWVNYAKPDLNFINKDGLPAVPFRTDDFPLTTLKK
jgi:sialate O-acetylesterase